MTKKERETLRDLIDESYKLDHEIKMRQYRLDANKKDIKELTAKSNLKLHRGHVRKCAIYDKSYGFVKDPNEVWKACKRNRKLFYSLIKVKVT